MGKRQHAQDRMYITATEHAMLFGGKRADVVVDQGFKRLPFDCCALSLSPFETPVATSDGLVFDLLNIVPYIKKHGVNPVTGQSMAIKDLIKLHYHKYVLKMREQTTSKKKLKNGSKNASKESSI